MPLNNESKEWLVNVQRESRAKVEQVRARRDLTPEAKRAGVAKIHRETKRAVESAQERFTSQVASGRKTNATKLWGIADVVTGSGAMALGDATTAYRDAGDRAAALETPQQAAALMARAEQSGDELLARAVAARCYAERGPIGDAWQAPLQEYLEARPAKAQAMQGLQENESVSMADMGYFWVDTPREVEGLTDTQVDHIADEMDVAS